MADPEFILLGDALWLDFANTAPFLPHRHDHLPDHAAYVRWNRALKLSAESDVAIDRVRRLRDQLLEMAQCLDAGRTPSSALTQAIMPAPTVSFVPSSMRMNEPVARLRG